MENGFQEGAVRTAAGRLAASVAHEINNPLQAIALHLQLLTDDSLSPHGQQRLDVVQQEFDRIAHIVRRLLDFQRPEEGQRQLVRVTKAVEYVITLAERQLQRSGVTLVQRAISHEIITNHGGELTVHNTPGTGATFTIMLPVTEG